MLRFGVMKVMKSPINYMRSGLIRRTSTMMATEISETQESEKIQEEITPSPSMSKDSLKDITTSSSELLKKTSNLVEINGMIRDMYFTEVDGYVKRANFMLVHKNLDNRLMPVNVQCFNLKAIIILYNKRAEGMNAYVKGRLGTTSTGHLFINARHIEVEEPKEEVE